MSEELPPITKALRQRGLLATHDIVQMSYPHLVTLNDAARRARTLEDNVAVQKALARAAVDAADLHRQASDRKAEMGSELLAAKQKGDMEQVARLDRQIRDFHGTIEANKLRRYAYRVVQDGAIWRALGFNRDLIAMLGEGTPVNFPSASFRHEAAVAEQHWNEGRLAMFADLSNVVRTGDLLVIDAAANVVGIAEEKMSGKGPSPSQKQRIAAKIEYLNTGRTQALRDDMPTLAPASRPRLRTNLSLLGDLLARAAKRGYAYGRANEAAVVYAYDGRDLDDDGIKDVALRAAAEGKRRVDQLRWDNRDIVLRSSVDRIDEDRKNAVPSLAPYSIFPLDSETCISLAFGWTGYHTMFNTRVLKAALERRGWAVEFLPPRQRHEFFLILRDARGELRMPGRIAHHLLLELVTVASFVEMVEATAATADSVPDQNVAIGWAWRREDRVWR